VRAGIAYGLLRVGLFAVVFALLLLVRLDLWWLWAIVAAVVSLCVGYIFFGRLRDAASRELAQRRPPKRDDEDAEDASDG
jgi:divalent metal cation (Fe/Co/Zn/Cd) transporter